MPLLGGHRPHKNADQRSIKKRGLDLVHQNYAMANDIAKQLKLEAKKKGPKLKEKYKEMYDKNLKKKNFIGKFKSIFNKWITKESIEVD